MGVLTFDISKFAEILFSQALELFQCFGLYEYDNDLNTLKRAVDIENKLKLLSENKQVKAMWLAFSTAYELLLKAVLIEHNSLSITYKDVTGRQIGCGTEDVLPEVAKVFEYVRMTKVKASSNPYLGVELIKNKINYLYDLSTGELGSQIGNLKKLVDNKIITVEERICLHQACHTLRTVRRNIDAHTFYNLTISQDINGDITNVYLPSINLLLDIYRR